jgi:DNA invertase Pin-like site-specific DNA recombinase
MEGFVQPSLAAGLASMVTWWEALFWGVVTSTAAGKAFLDMLGVFAEFETNLRKERQLEGIAKAKAAGVYKGRKPTVNVVRVKALKQDGLGPSAIAKALGIGRASVYRALGEQTGEA